jgi:hypothetical protein
MNNPFMNIKNVNNIKSTYKKLCFIHHPDIGGNDEDMKQLNSFYHSALKLCDGQISKDDKGKEYRYTYTNDVEQHIMDMLHALLQLKMEGVRILLVGKWLWIEGETKKYRQDLKNLGCRWHNKRLMWFWYGQKKYRCRISKQPFNHICKIYGLRNFDDESLYAPVKI